MRLVSAVLFDVDGVLLDSRESTERGWMEWARRRGVDPAVLRGSMHGVRSADVIRAVAPALDAASEGELVERIQEGDTQGVRPIPGAAEALAALDPGRVAAVTSATRSLATARLAAAGIEPPRVILYAGDVGRGNRPPRATSPRRPGSGWTRRRRSSWRTPRRVSRPGERRGRRPWG